MKNRIAVKLTLYFFLAIVIFGLVIGVSFYQFFAKYTVEIKRQEMSSKADRIAEVISDSMSQLEYLHGKHIARSRFVTYLDNVTNEILWVVDEDRTLNMNRSRLSRSKLPSVGVTPDGKPIPFPKDGREAYENLPREIKQNVEQAFAGHGFIVQEYSHIYNEVMLTVGKPVRNRDGQVKAVVLLHAPVDGLSKGVWAALRIFLISLGVGAVAALLLSIFMSWRFTKPLNKMKDTAERLAEKDYAARCSIKQNDEVGELAKTLDELSTRLQLADEESQKLEQLRRDFIANISHELRTPVTVIKGSLEALRDGVITEPADVQEFHEQMYKESNFLQRLINDLLDLSRLQNADFAIEKQPLNICSVVEDVVRSARHLAKDKNLNVEAELDTDSYIVEGDYGRLRQMLLVFLHNSVKFSPENASIKVWLRGNTLSVQDFGCGMKPEDMAHAFDRFYKAHNEQNKTGSGLGLAIAKQIALRHNMQLELVSEEGKGTIVTVTLPQAMQGVEQED